MITFYASRIWHAATMLEHGLGMLLTTSSEDEAWQKFLEQAKKVPPLLKSLPVSSTLVRLADDLADPPLKSKDAIIGAVGQFQENLHMELNEHLFLCVPSKDKKMYEEPERWFGEAVVAKFGNATLDMRDCARSLALAQWTASVFHAMRILEHGLRTLADRVGVTFVVPMELENWKNIIDVIEKEIRAQESLPKSVAKSTELQFCSAAAAHFWYVKEAWRNHVSHSRSNYDEDGAGKIVTHVRDFMAALA